MTAGIEGFGKCGICQRQIETPTPPLRHYQGHIMAHASCFNRRMKYEQTDEFKVETAEKAVREAKQRFEAARHAVNVAESELEKIKAALQV